MSSMLSRLWKRKNAPSSPLAEKIDEARELAKKYRVTLRLTYSWSDDAYYLEAEGGSAGYQLWPGEQSVSDAMRQFIRVARKFKGSLSNEIVTPKP